MTEQYRQAKQGLIVAYVRFYAGALNHYERLFARQAFIRVASETVRRTDVGSLICDCKAIAKQYVEQNSYEAVVRN